MSVPSAQMTAVLALCANSSECRSRTLSNLTLVGLAGFVPSHLHEPRLEKHISEGCCHLAEISKAKLMRHLQNIDVLPEVLIGIKKVNGPSQVVRVLQPHTVQV